MTDLDADANRWRIPEVYLKFAPADLVKEYGNEVCALIYHVIRGVTDVEPDGHGKPAHLRYLPEALLKEYGEELPELLARAALGCLESGEPTPGVPAFLSKLTKAEIEDWEEDIFRLAGGICEAFRVYPFLQSVPENLMLDFGDADTIAFVLAVLRGVVEGKEHPEWVNPHLHYLTATMQADWEDMPDILARALRGILEYPGDSRQGPAFARHLSKQELDEYGDFFPFVAAVCDGWLRHKPVLPPQRSRDSSPMQWRQDGVILDDYLIERELGRGGMGRVWLVKSNSTGRRFAVKQALIRDDKHRKAFLTELQTWIDLPEHPNIVPCRFFRTVGDEIVIFADYIEGGSLADWIAKRKLTSLEKILDVAIQFAWGLHAIHERGLIHQDVKPGNVLMTADGVPMVTDFGLARARLRAADGSFVSPALPPGQQSVLVSSGGMTPAYASPEQRAGQPLSRKTDIWSWGVSVLDMFMGGVSCAHGGHIAADVLEDFLEQGKVEEENPEMPTQVAEAIKKCFTLLPTARWTTILEPADLLAGEYKLTVGRLYPRRKPFGHSHLEVESLHPAQDFHGWTDPTIILNAALHLAGKKKGDGRGTSKGPTGPRSASGDLAIYEEAKHLLEQLVSCGRKDLDVYLAELYSQKAAVHRFLGDASGALQLVERAIDLLQGVVKASADWKHMRQLASAYSSKIAVLERTGDLQSAVPLCDQTIRLWGRIVIEKGRPELTHQLAMAFANAASIHINLHNLEQASSLCDSAIKLVATVSEELRTPDKEVDKALAHAYATKATVLVQMKDARGALIFFDRAIAIRADLVSEHRCLDMIPHLAASYTNKAIALHGLGQHREAAGLCEKAVDLMKGDARSCKTADSLARIAGALAVKASAVASSGNALQAVALYEEAIAIRERLVSMEGQVHLAEALYRLRIQRERLLAAAGAEIRGDGSNDQLKECGV